MTEVTLIKYLNLAIPQPVMGGVNFSRPQVGISYFDLYFIDLKCVYQRLYVSKIFMQQLQ